MRWVVKFVQQVTTWFYTKLLNLRGTRQLTQLPEQQLHIDGISVLSVRGFRVSFFCQEVRYILTHENVRWSKEFVIYRLYSTCDDSAPIRLRRVLTEDVFIPSIVPHMVRHSVRRKLLLEAYIDILKAKIMELGPDESDSI